MTYSSSLALGRKTAYAGRNQNGVAFRTQEKALGSRGPAEDFRPFHPMLIGSAISVLLDDSDNHTPVFSQPCIRLVLFALGE